MEVGWSGTAEAIANLPEKSGDDLLKVLEEQNRFVLKNFDSSLYCTYIQL